VPWHNGTMASPSLVIQQLRLPVDSPYQILQRRSKTYSDEKKNSQTQTTRGSHNTAPEHTIYSGVAVQPTFIIDLKIK